MQNFNDIKQEVKFNLMKNKLALIWKCIFKNVKMLCFDEQSRPQLNQFSPGNNCFPDIALEAKKNSFSPFSPILKV